MMGTNAATETTTANVRTYEREEKFFGFPPIRFVDDVINAVNDYCCDALDEVENTLHKHTGTAALTGERRHTAAQITNSVNEVMNYMQKNCIDRNFDKFELYVFNNIFTLPENFPLESELSEDSTDTASESGLTVEDEHQLENEIQQMRALIIEERRRNRELQREQRRLQLDLQYFNQYKERIDSIQSICSSENVTSLDGLMRSVIGIGRGLADTLRSTQERAEQCPAAFQTISLAAQAPITTAAENDNPLLSTDDSDAVNLPESSMAEIDAVYNEWRNQYTEDAIGSSLLDELARLESDSNPASTTTTSSSTATGRKHPGGAS